MLVYTEVGVWEPNTATNEWVFRMSECYAPRDINFYGVRSYDDIVSLVKDSFNLECEGKRIVLTYLAPTEAELMLLPSEKYNQYICEEIDDDVAANKFLLVLGSFVDTKLHVTLVENHVDNDLTSGHGEEKDIVEICQMERDLHIDDSMLALIEKVEEEYRRSRGLGTKMSSPLGDSGIGQATKVAPSTESETLYQHLAVPSTPMGTCINRGHAYSPSSVLSKGMNNSPIEGGRGQPTLETPLTITPASGSRWFRAVSADAVNTPITPVDVERVRKGKEKCFEYNDTYGFGGALPQFDLGIDGIDDGPSAETPLTGKLIAYGHLAASTTAPSNCIEGGRGQPTLDTQVTITPVSGSGCGRAESAEVGNSPITQIDSEGGRKGKGICFQDKGSDRCENDLTRLDLCKSGVNDEGGASSSRVGTEAIVRENVDFPSYLFVDPPPQMTYLPSPEEEGLVHVGCTFPHKKDFHMALSVLALQQYFCFKIHHSDKSRVYAGCVDPKFRWRVCGKLFEDSDVVEITKIVPKHTCGAKTRARYVEKATARVLAQLLTPKFGNGKQGPRACHIPDMVLSELKVPITYMKAWYAKEVAVSTTRGKEDENYRLLCRYLSSLRRSNPGSLTDVLGDVDVAGIRKFRFLFVAFAAAMSSWPYMRKVIGIDGTHLKGKYKGCLVSACCQDGNFQIAPLAIGVVDSENIDSWVWFLENLSQIVTDDREVLFISDRHPSIYAAVKQVYPLSTHVFCIVHLYRNVKQMFKCGGLANMVNRCARAYTKTDFRYWWTQIENLSPECAKYLKNEGFPYWARSYCEGMRYNLMSSNICESFNHAIGKSVDYPIITMVEFVRTMMMTWFKDRRDEAGKCRTTCTPNVEKLLIKTLKVASDMKIIAADRYVYQVNDTRGWSYTVDLKNRCCTCNAFQALKIPCSHALAAMSVHKDDIYSFVDPLYLKDKWMNVYAGVIMPVPNNDDNTEDDEEECEELLPPKAKRPAGRPKKARIRSSGECFQGGSGRAGRCGRCLGFGHNRATCKNSI